MRAKLVAVSFIISFIFISSIAFSTSNQAAVVKQRNYTSHQLTRYEKLVAVQVAERPKPQPVVTTTTQPPAPAPVASEPVAAGIDPNLYAAWTRVAVCEEGGWVGSSGSAYPNSLGINAQNLWLVYLLLVEHQ